MQDNSVALADSAAEQYASVMDGLIADCNHLEDRVAELENRLQRAVQERDAAAAERTTSRCAISTRSLDSADCGQTMVAARSIAMNTALWRRPLLDSKYIEVM